MKKQLNHNGQMDMTQYTYIYSFMNSTPDEYYAMPKFLIKEKFANLCSDAKVLYTCMRDRVSLSIKNKWVDDNGYVYIIFTISETAKCLGISKNTALKAQKQLADAGLIEKVNMGTGKPDRIYVKDYIA